MVRVNQPNTAETLLSIEPRTVLLGASQSMSAPKDLTRYQEYRSAIPKGWLAICPVFFEVQQMTARLDAPDIADPVNLVGHIFQGCFLCRRPQITREQACQEFLADADLGVVYLDPVTGLPGIRLRDPQLYGLLRLERTTEYRGSGPSDFPIVRVFYPFPAFQPLSGQQQSLPPIEFCVEGISGVSAW